MRVAVPIALLLLSAAPHESAAQPASSAPRLSTERIFSGPTLWGTTPSALAWSADSRTLAFLWNDEARPARDLWTVAANGTQPTRLTTHARADSAVSEFAWEPDGAGLVYLQRGDVYRIAATGGEPQRLTQSGAGKSSLAVSPDGRFVSWLHEGDLWLLNRATRDVVRATHVGEPGPGSVPLGTYNRPDVEFGRYVWGGSLPAYLWSPDSRHVALHYVDRRKVRKVPFPYYLGDETSMNVLRRGYPGDHDEIRSVGIYSVPSGLVRILDFPDHGWRHINGYEWSRDGRLLIDQLADTQQERWIHVFDPRDGGMAPWWHDRRDSRVYSAFEATWSSDGQAVLLVGDADDRYRLYGVRRGSTTPTPLTPAGYDVSDVTVAGSAAARSVFFVTNEKNPYERHVARMPEAGGRVTTITARAGTHQPTVSPDGSTVALVSSDDQTPGDLYLVDARGGSAERRITTSPLPEFAQHRWARVRYLTVKSRIDDYTIHARILEPATLDPARKYPVLFGPVYSNTVRNRFNGAAAAFQHFLVEERGYIVVQVDVRGSTGYGRAFREAFLMDYGGKDLDDLQSVLEHLKSVPYIDTARAGIYGSSYGGLLATYMLFKKPGLFAAGVAAASAVDPRFFGTDDVAITRLPNTHPDTYRLGAAREYAKNLRDPLLFIHGMQDDVVPFKTIVDLMEQLMLLGKDFDLAIAPGATHGWGQRSHYATFLYRKLLQHFDRHLQGTEAASTR